MMRTSHLGALRALEAALRTGSFRSAADDLGVTTAAVGQQIRGLEEFVGCQLFVRKPSGAMPTEAAIGVASELTAGFGSISTVPSTSHSNLLRLFYYFFSFCSYFCW